MRVLRFFAFWRRNCGAQFDLEMLCQYLVELERHEKDALNVKSKKEATHWGKAKESVEYMQYYLSSITRQKVLVQIQ